MSNVLDNIAFGLQQANAAAKKLVARMDAAVKQITTAQYNNMLANGWQVVWEPRGPYHVAELKNSAGRTTQFEVTDWRNDAARHDVGMEMYTVTVRASDGNSDTVRVRASSANQAERIAKEDFIEAYKSRSYHMSDLKVTKIDGGYR